MAFFGCLIGTFLGTALYDFAFNRYVDKKIEDNYEKRWFE